MSQKSNKSIASRIRVTKTGKIMARKKGHAHFNAKEPRTKQLNRKGSESITLPPKVRQRFINQLK